MKEKSRSTRVKAPDIVTLKISTGEQSQNDAGTLNHSRRAPAEDQWKSKDFMKCKKDVKVATFNARTLKSPTKIGELVALSNLYNISVIAIQEHRMVHDDVDVKFQNLDGGWK